MSAISDLIGYRASICRQLIAAALVTCVPHGANAQPIRANIEVGARPADFDLLPAGRIQDQWTVVRDATATAGVAIEHSGVDASEDRPALAIYKPAFQKNADISLRFKAIAGNASRGGGVALRVTTPDSYYLVQADSRRDRVLFLRVSKGEAEEIAGVDADIADNTWHTLGVRAEDDGFEVSLDGVWVVTAYDKTLSGPGRVALWTNADSVTRFDSITILPLPASEERY